MSKLQKMTIVVPRSKYYNEIILYLGKERTFHFINVDKSKFRYNLFSSRQKMDIENNLKRTSRLIEKFNYRKLKIPKVKKEIVKISFEPEKFNKFLRRIEKRLEFFERNVSNYELNEGQIEKRIENFSVNDDDTVVLPKLKKKLESFTKELEKVFFEYYKEILEIHNNLTFLNRYINAFGLSGGNELIAIIKGWVPKKSVKKLKKEIMKLSNSKCSIKIEDPEKDELPPTLIEANKLLKPFEVITEQYGVPNYYELNPSKLVAFLFPLLFGLMFGDIGQGLVISIACGIILLYSNRTIPKVLFWCGIGTIICGFLYGEFFGFSFQELGWPIPPLLIFIPKILSFLPQYNPNGESMLQTNYFLLIKFSLLIGTIQLLLGYSLQAINQYRKKKYADLLSFSIPIMLFILFFMYSFFIFGLSIQEYLTPSIFTCFLMPIIFIIIPLIALLFNRLILSFFHYFKELRSESRKQIFGESVLQTWETLIGFISNISSYLRIFALIAIHWAFTMIFKLFVNMIPQINIWTAITSGVVIGVGNALIIIIEILLVSAQTLRLTFYEWFTKFFEGNGKKFTPFLINSKNFIIEEKW
ncbi:MAG: V-type ATPase 116kDa subunit family protein [Candidatus Helarchaeota archaeon]